MGSNPRLGCDLGPSGCVGVQIHGWGWVLGVECCRPGLQLVGPSGLRAEGGMCKNRRSPVWVAEQVEQAIQKVWQVGEQVQVRHRLQDCHPRYQKLPPGRFVGRASRGECAEGSTGAARTCAHGCTRHVPSGKSHRLACKEIASWQFFVPFPSNDSLVGVCHAHVVPQLGHKRVHAELGAGRHDVLSEVWH